MAERVVDWLEPVEVEEEDRADVVTRGRLAKRFAEQLADPAAVR
jgi:hypothetical protein